MSELERIRQIARECEATYPYRIDLRNGESYWVAIPFEDHPALVGEWKATESIARTVADRETRERDRRPIDGEVPFF